MGIYVVILDSDDPKKEFWDQNDLWLFISPKPGIVVLFIDRKASEKQGGNGFGSVCPFVVCQYLSLPLQGTVFV